MIINRNKLFEAKPILNMKTEKHKHVISSFGLVEAGYDIRIAESIIFYPNQKRFFIFNKKSFIQRNDEKIKGRFCLASAIEKFQMPNDLVGIVHDKSTWARQGLSVFNTVIEPGWSGYLTLELKFNGEEELYIPYGSGIAQVIFHQITEKVTYEGKYQNQKSGPQKARFNKIKEKTYVY